MVLVIGSFCRYMLSIYEYTNHEVFKAKSHRDSSGTFEDHQDLSEALTRLCVNKCQKSLKRFILRLLLEHALGGFALTGKIEFLPYVKALNANPHNISHD